MAGAMEIARNTSFTFGHKAVDSKEVGRKLGVRYVTEGSIRRTGDRAWAERAEHERPASIGFGPLRLLASSYAHLDRPGDARDTFASVLKVTPRSGPPGDQSTMW